MADISKKYPENVSGIYFVDQECISCGACWSLAPKHFASHKIHTFAYVCCQPESYEENQLVLEALKICPVAAIGIEE